MIEVIIRSKGNHFIVTQRSGSLNRSDNIEGLGQEVSFDYVFNRHDRYTRDLRPELGDGVILREDNTELFEGTLTAFSDNYAGAITYTAFDHGHILAKNQCYIQFSDIATDVAITHLCKCHGIEANCCSIPEKVNKNYYGDTLADAIKDMIGMATFATGKKYRLEVRGQKVFVEEYKDLEIELISKSATNTGVFDPLMAGANISSTGSTDKMFNYVKVLDDDGKLLSMAKDDESIKRFGRYHKVETGVTAVADSILKSVKDPEVTLTLTLMGDNKCRSGRVITIDKKKYIVTNCSHSYTGNTHTMQVDLQDASKVDAAVKEVNPNEGGSGDGGQTPNTDMKKINDMLGKQQGVFTNKGPLIVSLAEKYGIPPTLAVAVICSETGYGTAVYGNNPAGIMDPATNCTRLKQYASIDQGLDDAIRNMANIWNRGGKTIAGMGAIYCPVGAANDPNGLNKNWVPSVTSMVNQMGGLYTQPRMVSGGSGLQSKIIKAAETMLGWGYSQGMRNSQGMCDCSSFTHRALVMAGILPPYTGNAFTTDTFIANFAPVHFVQVSRAALQPGDVLYMYGHIGLYHGAGNAIECTPPRAVIQPMSYNPWQSFWRAKKVMGGA